MKTLHCIDYIIQVVTKDWFSMYSVGRLLCILLVPPFRATPCLFSNPALTTYRMFGHPPMMTNTGPTPRAPPQAACGPRQPPHPLSVGTCSRLPTTPMNHRDTLGEDTIQANRRWDSHRLDVPGTG